MYLKFIARGTAMQLQSVASESAYDAVFYDVNSDMSFFAESEALYNDFQALGVNAALKVTFSRGGDMYNFTGRVKNAVVERGAYLTLIEQWSDIAFQSRRSDDRNEMRVGVRLFGLTQAAIDSADFRKISDDPEFSADTFDVSTGGLCLVANEYLSSKYEPYFLAEFTLNRKSEFLLPVRLIRKGNCPQTVMYRNDYGLLFMYESLPEEKARLSAALTDALFRERLSGFGRLK